MKASIGIDCVEIARFRRLRGASRRHFLERVFSGEERRYCGRFEDADSRLAGTFAAKEAVVKVLSGRVAVADIEVLRKSTGSPTVKVRGRLRRDISVSITRAGGLACAVALVL
ncbi:hypothetical protein A3D72_01075 [Candidatus Uhrbacteria bacterium RIFCSPHIGHO2_02_FULL_57_19]|uniref:Holo-[acyl-carrier-protein] synthase n=2 Tax=Parcubacteria group TaxID=1794811 RepID=A0A1F6CLM0_9BACT|nr:MAG: hypothetical protein A2704_04515 [Candidatus Kaiserbacteria bacterium RIFCSPHIGHO2_01_FULL_54_36b]OGL72410.1 MAG: hypothetical protein A3D72_01075 [Candidatus Uhrbacteria bacterium RIFCSPHIGHO2_02_FULL_57_19]